MSTGHSPAYHTSRNSHLYDEEAESSYLLDGVFGSTSLRPQRRLSRQDSYAKLGSVDDHSLEAEPDPRVDRQRDTRSAEHDSLEADNESISHEECSGTEQEEVIADDAHVPLASQPSEPIRHIWPSLGRHRCVVCRRPCFVSPHTRKISEYCGQTHRRGAVTSRLVDACLGCGHWPQALLENGKRGDFCSRPHARSVLEAAPILLELEESGHAYRAIEHLFITQWRHKTQIPEVIRVLKHFEPRRDHDAYLHYRASVTTVNFGFRDSSRGNERLLWHGTDRYCLLGEESQKTAFCDDVNCSVCMICKTSFHLLKAGTKNAWGRFGRGIYSSSASSKANDYVYNQSARPQPGTTKAMILARVACGKEKECTRNQPDLTAPPPGYDSVMGKPGSASVLNYDEHVVYTDDAIRPAYIVVYR